MKNYKTELETLANLMLKQDTKINYSNRDFMNASIIFMSALTDKMYDNQDYDGMPNDDRVKMAEKCGRELHKLIHTYTGLDIQKVEEFL